MSVDSGLARHGHVSYLEIPAIDAEQSAAFYEVVFGWAVDRRGKGDCRFNDRSGALIGRWVQGRAASPQPAFVPYIYMDGISTVIEAVKTHGGKIVKPMYPEGDLWIATFSDPAGNLLGIWQAKNHQ